MRLARIASVVLLVALASCEGESGTAASAGDAGGGDGSASAFVPERDESGRWTVASANEWWAGQPWLVGCNFVPSTAINQLEMWQAATFDLTTIDRELGWAAELGFNVVRVFLHDLLWEQDAAGLLARIDEFLAIADRHGIRTMLVLFDNVWNPQGVLGEQPAPEPGVHNSGWVQSPAMAETVGFATDEALQVHLEGYVKGIMEAFADDPRVLVWDLLNEPGNSLIGDFCRPLLEAAFAWAREVRPTQPVTAGVWREHASWEISLFQVEQSDVVSFHSYATADEDAALVASLRTLTDRPLLCTEYMARTVGSRFETHLPLWRDEAIAAFNWGLVAGKTQTLYSWTEVRPDGSEPHVWFHDILRADGAPYDPDEVAFIKEILDASDGSGGR